MNHFSAIRVTVVEIFIKIRMNCICFFNSQSIYHRFMGGILLTGFLQHVHFFPKLILCLIIFAVSMLFSLMTCVIAVVSKEFLGYFVACTFP